MRLTAHTAAQYVVVDLEGVDHFLVEKVQVKEKKGTMESAYTVEGAKDACSTRYCQILVPLFPFKSKLCRKGGACHVGKEVPVTLMMSQLCTSAGCIPSWLQ